MFLIATADADGWPEVSYKGGAPGFVRVLDERTLAFPLYDGNGMYLTVGNLVVNPRAGLLFIDLESGARLRVNGDASIDSADPLLDASPGAQLIVRVTTRAVFANCRRYVHRYQLVEASPFVPEAGVAAPVPAWKLDPLFDGTLPEDDPAHDPEHPSAPAIPKVLTPPREGHQEGWTGGGRHELVTSPRGPRPAIVTCLAVARCWRWRWSRSRSRRWGRSPRWSVWPPRCSPSSSWSPASVRGVTSGGGGDRARCRGGAHGVDPV